MEERWSIKLGDEETKLRLLHLDFLAGQDLHQSVLQEDTSDEMDDDEDENETDLTSRMYWETRSDPQAMEMVDQILEIIKSIAEPKVYYIKSRISIETTGRLFIWCYPRKSARLAVRLRVDNERDRVVSKLHEKGMRCNRGKRPEMARLILVPEDLDNHREHLAEAIKIAEGLSH